MAFKCFLLTTMLATTVHGIMVGPAPLTGASHYPSMVVHGVPAIIPAVAKEIDSYDTNPQYNYAYSVQDDLTGDSKTQYETRDGGVVQGSYSLVEPDGTRRVVDYTADPVNGFNAVVRKEPAVVKTHAAIAVTRPFPAAAVAHAPLTFTTSPYRYSAPGFTHGAVGLAYH